MIAGWSTNFVVIVMTIASAARDEDDPFVIIGRLTWAVSII